MKIFVAVAVSATTFVMSPVIIAADASNFWCGDIVARFNADCATTQAYPRALLEPEVRRLLTLPDWQVGHVWADRAFPLDLNGDGAAEYFVPIACGATGNCSWAVFGGRPPRLIARLDAERIYVHERQENNAWSVITAYLRNGATVGLVEQFTRRASDPSYRSMGANEIGWVIHDAFLLGMGELKCGEVR